MVEYPEDRHQGGYLSKQYRVRQIRNEKELIFHFRQIGKSEYEWHSIEEDGVTKQPSTSQEARYSSPMTTLVNCDPTRIDDVQTFYTLWGPLGLKNHIIYSSVSCCAQSGLADIGSFPMGERQVSYWYETPGPGQDQEPYKMFQRAAIDFKRVCEAVSAEYPLIGVMELNKQLESTGVVWSVDYGPSGWSPQYRVGSLLGRCYVQLMFSLTSGKRIEYCRKCGQVFLTARINAKSCSVACTRAYNTGKTRLTQELMLSNLNEQHKKEVLFSLEKQGLYAAKKLFSRFKSKVYNI